eukprot:Plantae.Rhodophyta-Rhodochaete_pulchella.ctg580.p1 GENE.Plantae.Rhodophyta-Rhodochaete_pulchella.ctg580~~Plantae.Rhodophyta-Rhodochaete_pulchella.ctg580.p1  ORF type:complete len:253 (-),score=23.74 Plantae.Rhodophyta-Rhodochaete_pulchella.ctg580:551-1309(-)
MKAFTFCQSMVVARRPRVRRRCSYVSVSSATPHPLQAANRAVVDAAVTAIDKLYSNAPNTPRAALLATAVRRFWVLETVARVPYFSYLSVLHLRQTLGARGTALTPRTRAHFAEADNEAFHLAVMESLGGGSQFFDRFLAQHVSFFYYWMCVGLYFFAPAAAYHMNELIEHHAYKTYDAFVRSPLSATLAETPAPDFACAYYGRPTSQRETTSGPPPPVAREVATMLDLFYAIRDDEAAHADALLGYQSTPV